MAILRINMSTLEATRQELPENWRLLGGRGLTSTIVAEEVPANCDPLGEDNKLVFAPGLLTSTGAPSSGRMSVGAKSPLTMGLKEANGGGMGGLAIAKLGLEAIILEGKSEELYIAVINSEGVSFVPASDFKEVMTYETCSRLKSKYGAKTAVICIGPAGERQYAIAGVAITDMDGNPSRYAARGGLGAVMGAKGVKAMVIDPGANPGRPKQHPEEFKKVCKEWITALYPRYAGLRTFGTINSVGPNNEKEVMPNHGFCGRPLPEEVASAISGPTVAEMQKARGGKNGHVCHPGCIVKCSNIYNDSEGNYLTSGFEYETVALTGANCDIFDIDAIARMDRFCDDFGLDTIDFGGTIAMAMEGGIIPFGDVDAWWQMTEEIKNNTIIGRVLGQGTGVAGKVFGSRRITAVKGQGFPGYDPRAYKGTGVTYSTSPQGACHTAGCTLPGRTGFHEKVAVPMDPSVKEGMVLLSRDLQALLIMCDSLGLCSFFGSNPTSLGYAAQAINAAYGTDISFLELAEQGEKLVQIEMDFNRRAGVGIGDVPEFFRKEKTAVRHLIFDIDHDEMLALWDPDFVDNVAT